MATTPDTAFLPFAKPSITQAEKRAVLEVLDSGWLTTGPKAHAFEEAFRAYVGVDHAVAVNSATAALHLALEAVGVGPGDEVILPTWTFAATGEVVIYRSATPVLVDVQPGTLNADVEAILQAITPKTRAVIAVHFAGLPMATQSLVDQLSGQGIPIIEDAAHAFPSRVGDGQFAGTVGRAGAYSFYANKTITTGEGGMLVTNDGALADRARLMSLHGISRQAWQRYSASGSWQYEIEDAGFKYNLTDIAAALGLAQLLRADELHRERRRLATLYASLFEASPIADLIELPRGSDDPAHAWHLFVVRLHLERIERDRAGVIDGLRDRGIGSSVHFIPLHLHPYYRQRWATRSERYPTATREYERVISLPLWPGMTRDNVMRVVDGLAGAILDKDRVT